jgi:hypothetical protein
MRVIGGKYRRRILRSLPGRDLRPTADRLRETLFNVLTAGNPAALEGTFWLDLFAGTGALGVEALSRGAAMAYFVEGSVKAAELIRKNLQSLGVDAGFRVSGSALPFSGSLWTNPGGDLESGGGEVRRGGDCRTRQAIRSRRQYRKAGPLPKVGAGRRGLELLPLPKRCGLTPQGHISSSLARRTIGCCISCRSFFTRFRPYTHCSNCFERLANMGATLVYSKCSNLETI